MINHDYLDYLKEHETRIPNYDYGEEHIKPFYGVLMEKNNLCYVTTINHFKEKYIGMNSSIDFQKIYDFQYGEMIAAAHLNYMFPVPKDQFKRLDYRNLNQYVKFKDYKAEYNQITLMKKILLGLNHSNLQKRAEIIYDHKYQHPNTALAKRSFDFKELEDLAINYKIDHTIDEEDYDITDVSEEISEILDSPTKGIPF